MNQIQVKYVDGIPYVANSTGSTMDVPLYVDFDDVRCSTERWVDLTLGTFESKILVRDVQRDYIVSTVWVGMMFDNHVWETATILERDDLTVVRAIANNRPDAMVNHEYWLNQMQTEGKSK